MKRMFKKSLAIILAAMMLICSAPIAGLADIELPDIGTLFASKAEAVTGGICGDTLVWTFEGSTGTLTIKGTGDMYDWPRNWLDIPWRSVKDGIKSVVIKSGVTSIGECAFIECYDLTSVSIPSSVTNIKRGAFAFCKNLRNITIPDSVTEIGSEVFVECISLKSIKIPDGVKTIELSAFSFCTALTSVTIPDSVTKIGNSAFEECSALTDVYYEGSKFEWEAITIENNNTDLTNATIHFAKEDIFTVTWIIDGDSMTRNYRPGDTISIPEAPAKVGYVFDGWSPEVPATMPAKNMTFTAEYIPAEYTIEFVIDNSMAVKEIYKVEGAFSIGDKIRLSDAVVTGEDGTKGVLPVIGKENKEQPGGPYRNVDGYKFAGWKVGTQTVNLVDFDITQEITITPEFIEAVTLNDTIRIKGYWEALTYDFVAYYAKSFDADGNPVYEAMPAEKVKTGESLESYYLSALGTINANLPEGMSFTVWKAEDGSAVANRMPAYGYAVYATYVSKPVSVFIDYNYFSKEFAPDIAERLVRNDQLSKYLHVGVDIENDIPDNEIISVAEMVRRMKIPDSLKPEGDYVLSRWKVYHVHDEAEVYDESKWHEGYNDEGTSIAKHPVIFRALWTDGLSGACGDNLTFVFDKDSGILTVNGTGDMWDWELFKDMPWYKYINDIEFVDISDGVTSIGDNAFYNCQKLEDIVIPDSVTKIGKSAFHNCTSLKDIIIPEGVTSIGEDAFYCCESIENITIPYGITSIGYRTFYLCNNLKSITIPVTVTSIGNYAFASCNRLTDVYYEGSKEEWNNISIGEENVMLLRAKIHYADCDHNFVPSVTVPATCTEDGVMTYTCECGDSFTEEIPATGHVPGSWNVSIPASCTVDGETILCCEGCGIILGSKNIPATGHVPGFWVIVVEPTTETEGSKIKCCDICGDLLEEESIPKLPPKDPVKDNAVVKTPSTSTISYGDAIILHVDASKIPEGGYVEWTASNGNFSYKPNDATCEISPKKSGDTTFTATVYDANGNAVLTDEQTMTAKAGFFDKIIAFFKGIFGLTKTYPDIFGI